MGSKRTHQARAASIPRHILMLLGLGSGVNNVPDEELRALWRTWRVPVTEHWQRHYGVAPFVAVLADEEGRPDAE